MISTVVQPSCLAIGKPILPPLAFKVVHELVRKTNYLRIMRGFLGAKL